LPDWAFAHDSALSALQVKLIVKLIARYAGLRQGMPNLRHTRGISTRSTPWRWPKMSPYTSFPCPWARKGIRTRERIGKGCNFRRMRPMSMCCYTPHPEDSSSRWEDREGQRQLDCSPGPRPIDSAPHQRQRRRRLSDDRTHGRTWPYTSHDS